MSSPLFLCCSKGVDDFWILLGLLDVAHLDSWRCWRRSWEDDQPIGDLTATMWSMFLRKMKTWQKTWKTHEENIGTWYDWHMAEHLSMNQDFFDWHWEPNQPPKFNKHWDSHLPYFRDLTALRQIRCSLRNTLVVHGCTERYFLESLIWRFP